MQAISTIFITKISFKPEHRNSHFRALALILCWVLVLGSLSVSDELWKSYLGISSFAFIAKKSAEYKNIFMFNNWKNFSQNLRKKSRASSNFLRSLSIGQHNGKLVFSFLELVIRNYPKPMLTASRISRKLERPLMMTTEQSSRVWFKIERSNSSCKHQY